MIVWRRNNTTNKYSLINMPTIETSDEGASKEEHSFTDVDLLSEGDSKSADKKYILIYEL